ncbi:DUF6716 putative glycosyltransferase [Isoptericola cucumis]|uniref:Uncharacterized protein n=1 Tax=Isoptericola cucumis TaxID=1776856 RepID=A0ABQ2B5V1_9MICO|nr:DUF6716 putative glycosyltransferase [Isoptericola cucumis]GGI08668.1 hypothetical protein GCM10007368_22310 [Isoptericola cucumis]
MTAGTTPRVLAVADSDSYLKWAVWTLARLRDAASPLPGDAPRVSAVVVRSPLAPSGDQVAAAVDGTGVAPPVVVTPGALRRLVRRTRPDVVLVAATGPVAELAAGQVLRALPPGRRPALVTGLPGMALPATPQGTGWRRWCDAFVVHAHAEAAPYAEEFARRGARPDLVLTRLPFLDTLEAGAANRASAPVRRVVLAAQAKVPATRPERVALLDGLARLAGEGYEVVVKLRARAGEPQTHHEEHPLDALWAAEHATLGHAPGAVGFATGPMSDQLTPDAALLTVSSTAGLEALARGLPTVFVADFGVSPELLNEPFAASGCLRRLDDVASTLRAGGPVPAPAWRADHYLHPQASGLPAAVADLARRAREGDLPAVRLRPWSRPRYVYTAARSALPAPLARALRR